MLFKGELLYSSELILLLVGAHLKNKPNLYAVWLMLPFYGFDLNPKGVNE